MLSDRRSFASSLARIASIVSRAFHNRSPELQAGVPVIYFTDSPGHHFCDSLILRFPNPNLPTAAAILCANHYDGPERRALAEDHDAKIAKLEKSQAGISGSVDASFMLFSAYLVFFMQAGFAMVRTLPEVRFWVTVPPGFFFVNVFNQLHLFFSPSLTVAWSVFFASSVFTSGG